MAHHAKLSIKYVAWDHIFLLFPLIFLFYLFILFIFYYIYTLYVIRGKSKIAYNIIAKIIALCLIDRRTEAIITIIIY